MSDRTFVDTNVLVYAVDESEPVKRTMSRRALAGDDYGELVLSSQVLSEFYVTVTRKLATPLSEEQAAEAVNRLAAANLTVSIDSTHVEQAIRTSYRCQISYWDGLIVAAASQAGCSCLLSEDLNDGQRFGPVLVRNPFRGVRESALDDPIAAAEGALAGELGKTDVREIGRRRPGSA